MMPGESERIMGKKSRMVVRAMAVVLLAAGGAAAQTPGDGRKSEQGYSYTFSDDPLAAGGMDVMNGIIKVRPRALRNTLIRPRLHFVTEMLKSVEAL
jgi:hypothetical protein